MIKLIVDDTKVISIIANMIYWRWPIVMARPSCVAQKPPNAYTHVHDNDKYSNDTNDIVMLIMILLSIILTTTICIL